MIEIWLGTSADAQVFAELVPSAFNILHVARPAKRGGGEVVLFKEGFGVNTVKHQI